MKNNMFIADYQYKNLFNYELTLYEVHNKDEDIIYFVHEFKVPNGKGIDIRMKFPKYKADMATIGLVGEINREIHNLRRVDRLIYNYLLTMIRLKMDLLSTIDP